MKVDIDIDELRAEVEITDKDVWGLDSTLAKVILPALLKFKECDTYSGWVAEDVDLTPEIRTMDSDRRPFAAKDYILGEMIWAFDRYVDSKIDTDEEPEHTRMRRGLRLFGKYYLDLWT